MTPSRQHHVRNLKYVSTTRVSLATKFVRMVTYLDRLQPIKTHDLSSRGLARSHDILKPSYLHYQAWQDDE